MSAAERRLGLESGQSVTIGGDVWAGGGVIICPGVSIGAGAVIGAGSVVTRTVPAGMFAAGNPCRVIRRIQGKGVHDQRGKATRADFISWEPIPSGEENDRSKNTTLLTTADHKHPLLQCFSPLAQSRPAGVAIKSIVSTSDWRGRLNPVGPEKKNLHPTASKPARRV